MSGPTDYAQNKINDAIWRGQALGAPTTHYYGLITASKGERINATVYAANDTTVVKIGGKYSFYKCTTAGTSNASLPAAYLAAAGEIVTDGTAVFTEQTAAMGSAAAMTEVAGGSYARVAVAASLANFAGTQAAGSTTLSTGTSGGTSNNAAIAFPTPSGQWHPTGGAIVGIVTWDASTGGNPWSWGLLSAPKSINNGDPAPSIGIAAWAAALGD